MILFTKEIFIQLKALTSMYVHTAPSANDGTASWQIYIQGLCSDNAQGHGDFFSTYIGMASKEEAFRIYQELMKQVVDSGEVSDLNNTLVDNVLKEP